MAKVLQHRRGTATEHSNFVGAEGEFTYDTSEKRVRVHDGLTKGGVPLAKVSEVTQVQTNLNSTKTELQNKVNEVAEAAGDAFMADIVEAAQLAGSSEIDREPDSLAAINARITELESIIGTYLDKQTPHVAETWVSGTSWYRKYSDGWIVQSGHYTAGGTSATIMFHKEMRDTNYNVSFSEAAKEDSTDTGGVGDSSYFSNRTTTSIRVSLVSGRCPFWRIEGYAKE